MKIHPSKILSDALSSFDEILFFPSIPWDHSFERQQFLITGFCNAHSTASSYCFAPTGLIDYAPWNLNGLKLFWAKLTDGRKRVDGGHHQYSHPLPDGLNYIEPKFSRGTNIVFSEVICLVDNKVKSLLTKKGRRLVYAANVNPFIEKFLKTADFSILDLAERRQESPVLSDKFKNLERSWASKVNLFVADNHATLSDYDPDRLSQGLPPGVYIPQGVGYYEVNYPRPSSSKTAAYLGNLHSAIDYKYFTDLINNNLDWTFKISGVLMSPDAKLLLQRPNVIYVGSIPSHQIPDFLSDAVLGLIPYKINSYTSGIFPTKLFEYIAHGLPVLSTPLPEMMGYENTGLLHISSESINLDRAIFSGGDFSRILSENTWKARFDAFGSAIKEVL